MTTLTSKKASLPYVIIGFVLSIFLLYSVYYTFVGFFLLFKTGLSDLLEVPVSALVLIIYGFIKNLLIISFLVRLVYLFLKKRRQFIKTSILFLIVKLVFDVVDTLTQNFVVLTSPDFENLLINLVRASLFTYLFVKYLRLSKKLPTIFVHGQ